MRFRLLVVLTFLIFAGFFVVNNSPLGQPCANPGSCKESLELSVDNGEAGVFSGRKITPPKVDLAEKVDPKKILGEETGTGEKHIYVDLATQTLSAYQGDMLFMQTLVSTGKWGKTPTGEFTIWEKIRSTKMSGGQGADYYYLPNVPYVMFFSGSGISAGRGFSLHGTYWHNNFGHPMSHGCVNMRTVDAEKLYYWVGDNNPGTKITIYGKAP
jgi:lipoprotein-anchoring transpeptidase ErfK/SrfK